MFIKFKKCLKHCSQFYMLLYHNAHIVPTSAHMKLSSPNSGSEMKTDIPTHILPKLTRSYHHTLLDLNWELPSQPISCQSSHEVINTHFWIWTENCHPDPYPAKLIYGCQPFKNRLPRACALDTNWWWMLLRRPPNFESSVQVWANAIFNENEYCPFSV